MVRYDSPKPSLALGLVILAFLSVQIALNPEATEYEISIYDAYPVAFWLGVLSLLLFGQYLALRGAVSGELRNRWRVGAAFVVLANCLLLLLPAIRYPLYAPGKADVMTFLGMVEHVLSTGYLEPGNYYPAAHVLGTAVSRFGGVDAQRAVTVLPAVFSVLYIVSTYVFLRELLPSKRAVVFTIPFVGLLLYTFENLMFSPSVFAYFLLPLVLFLYCRLQSTDYTRFAAVLLLTMFAFVFFHPIVTVFLGFLLVLVDASIRADRRPVVDSLFPTDRNATNLVTMLAVLFFSWYYSFESIVGSTQLVLSPLLSGESREAEAEHTVSVLERATPEIADVVQTGLYSYGLFGIVGLVGGTALGYIVLRRWPAGRSLRYYEWFFGATFVLFAVLSIGAFFFNITLTFNRLYRYVLLSGVVLVGIAAAYVYETGHLERSLSLVSVSLVLLMFLLAFFSLFMLYSSPLSHNYNPQITENEWDGMEWTFEHRDESLLIDELGTKQSRFYSAINGSSDVGDNVRRPDETDPPDHFGYNGSQRLGSQYDEPRYLLITELGRMEYPVLYSDYEQFWRFTPEDMRRLERDSTVQHVYDSGEFDAYYVRDG